MTIFDTLRNLGKKASCLNNIGCLYLKNKEFSNSLTFLNESIKISKELKKDNEANIKNYFIMGCRYYNKGLACFTNLKYLIELHMPL